MLVWVSAGFSTIYYRFIFIVTQHCLYGTILCTWGIVQRLIDCSFSQFLGVFRMLAARRTQGQWHPDLNPSSILFGYKYVPTLIHCVVSVDLIIVGTSVKGSLTWEFQFLVFSQIIVPPMPYWRHFKFLQKILNILKVKDKPRRR